MTKISIHGILAKEFSSSMNFKIRKTKEVIDAICVNHSEFRNRIVELSKEGIHYAIIANGRLISSLSDAERKIAPETIDLVPVIAGQGAVALAVGGAILYGAGAYIGNGFVAYALMFVGSAMLSIGLQMMLAPKPEAPERTSSTISGEGRSLMLSSKGNIAQQGSPVPIGYGRLRIGSSIIQSSVRSYPMQDLSAWTTDNS